MRNLAASLTFSSLAKISTYNYQNDAFKTVQASGHPVGYLWTDEDLESYGAMGWPFAVKYFDESKSKDSPVQSRFYTPEINEKLPSSAH